MISRTRLVIDPKWRPIDFTEFSVVWMKLRAEVQCSQFLGFDMEWTTRYEILSNDPNRTKSKRVSDRAATIQLSSATVTVILRIADLFDLLGCSTYPPSCSRLDLQEILTKVEDVLRSEAICKVGVGVNGDKEKLEQDYKNFVVNSCVDLAVMHNCTGGDMKFQSLKSLSELYTGRTLSKEVLIIRSNWGGPYGPLSPSQIDYAANDSESSYDICEKILLKMDQTRETCTDRTDYIFTFVNKEREIKRIKPRTKKVEPKDIAPDWCKGRAKPYYDNINVYNPNGEVVFTVDKTKAKWYVEKKKLAEVIEWRNGEGDEKEIASIKLFFSPNVEKFEDSHIRRNLEYFKLPKDNACVVCGRGKDLVRFAVVPLLYRKHFPSVYMSHNSFDLLLLCTTCFKKASFQFEKERSKVAEDFGIPLGHLTNTNLKLFEEKLIAYEKSICDELISKSMVDDLVAHNIHPSIKLSVSKEFYEMQCHRNIIIQLIRYANALSHHYQALEGSSTEASNVPSKGSGRNKLEMILPPERFEELKEYVERHAYTYPFCPWRKEEDGSLVRTASSPEGVRCILRGGEASHQNVLRQYSQEHHPDIMNQLPPKTRAYKAEDPHELPALEGHGFLVVRALIKKYSSEGNPSVGKNLEHAIGQFIYRWRLFFLTSMEPKFLPHGWIPEDGILQ